MNDQSFDKYRPEFETLGSSRVRNELMRKRWHKEKLSAARQWLERADVGDWMATHAGAAAKPPSKSRRKWLVFGLTVFGALFFAIRFFSSMR